MIGSGWTAGPNGCSDVPMRNWRRAFVPGKKKQEAEHHQGHRRSATGPGGCCGRARSGLAGCMMSLHLRTDGIEDLLRAIPMSKPRSMPGTRALTRDFPAQVCQRPLRKPCKDAPPGETSSWKQLRRQQSSKRICIEHAIADPSSGGPCSAGKDAANTSRKPLSPSPRWSPTAPPHGDHTPASPPGQHEPTPIVYLLVSLQRLLGD